MHSCKICTKIAHLANAFLTVSYMFEALNRTCACYGLENVDKVVEAEEAHHVLTRLPMGAKCGKVTCCGLWVQRLNHTNFEESSSALCHMCSKHYHPTQNLGQAEASTDTETATLDHHPHNNPAFSQGLAESVSLLTKSVTNA